VIAIAMESRLGCASIAMAYAKRRAESNRSTKHFIGNAISATQVSSLRSNSRGAACHSSNRVSPLARCQIDPKAIRADFEFLISTKLRWIWLKENFRDVAIPKLVAAATGIGIRKNRDNSKPNVEP